MTRTDAGSATLTSEREQRGGTRLPSGEGRALLEGHLLHHPARQRPRVRSGRSRSRAWTWCSPWRRPPMPASSGGCAGGGAVDPVLSVDGERRSAAQLDHRRLAGALPPGRVRPRSFARERGGHRHGRRLRVDAAAGRHGDDGRHSRRPDPLVASPHHHRHRLVRRPDDPGDDPARTGRRWRARVARARLGHLSLAAWRRRR